MERVPIDHGLFIMAFQRDSDYSNPYGGNDRAFLDLESGDMIFIEEDKKIQKKFLNKSKFLEIPGLSHGEHHEMFQEFLEDWTPDEELKKRFPYFGSIGGWFKEYKRAVDEKTYYDARNTWGNFHTTEIYRRAEEFLNSISTDKRQYTI